MKQPCQHHARKARRTAKFVSGRALCRPEKPGPPGAGSTSSSERTPWSSEAPWKDQVSSHYNSGVKKMTWGAVDAVNSVCHVTPLRNYSNRNGSIGIKQTHKSIEQNGAEKSNSHKWHWNTRQPHTKGPWALPCGTQKNQQSSTVSPHSAESSEVRHPTLSSVPSQEASPDLFIHGRVLR